MCLFSLFLSSHCLVLFYPFCFVGVAEEQGNQRLGKICLQAIDSESHSIEREFSLPLSFSLSLLKEVFIAIHTLLIPINVRDLKMEVRIPLIITTRIWKIILIFYLWRLHSIINNIIYTLSGLIMEWFSYCFKHKIKRKERFCKTSPPTSNLNNNNKLLFVSGSIQQLYPVARRVSFLLYELLNRIKERSQFSQSQHKNNICYKPLECKHWFLLL